MMDLSIDDIVELARRAKRNGKPAIEDGNQIAIRVQSDCNQVASAYLHAEDLCVEADGLGEDEEVAVHPHGGVKGGGGGVVELLGVWHPQQVLQVW